MAWICDKNGNHRCEIKKLTYNGTFMEVSSITVTVESPAPIAFAIGDYIDWDYDGLRYTLDTAAGVEKQATRNSVGNAFIYENLVFLSPLKAAENADFFDVILDNTNDFLTNAEFSFYGTAWDYAKRLEANLCRVYGSDTWKVRIWTSGACYDETPATGLDTGAWENKLVDVAGIKCLGGFQQIYDLWGCAYVFSVMSGVNYVDFYDDFEQYAKAWQAGGVDKIFAYGKGNGLYKIRHTPDADHVLVTRLRPYGSGDNLPPNYYLNSEDYHVDGNESSELAISHLMLPASQWTKDGVKHPANAFLEQNTDLYGVREGVVLWDGSDPELGEIKPSIYGLTIQDLLNLMASGDSYRPDEAKWPDTTQRIDKIITGAAPTDNGVKNEAGYDFTEVESSGSLAEHSFGTGGAYIDVEFNDLVMGTTPSVSHLAEFRIVPTSENKVAASFDVQASVASAIRAVNAYLTPYVGGVKISDATYPCTVTEEAISNTVEGITYTKRYKISLLDSTGNPIVFSSMYTGDVTFRIVAHIDFIGNPTGFPVVRNEYAVSFNLLRGNKAIDEYFSVTIPQIGFDLSAAVANGAKLCMRSGANQPREFQIIPSSVRYLPDTDTWFVRCKRSVDQSISTYFPNSNSVIAAGDEYYFTGIVMPPLYVEIAAQKLLTAATAWLALHSKPRMLSAVDVDNKIMAVEEIVLKEGMSLPLSDTDLGITPQNQESRVIDNIRIEEGSDPIRTFTITLRDKKEKSSLDAAIRGATSNLATNASVSEAVNAATGTGHGSLTGRDMPNQHPISAITGLEEALLSSGFFEYDPVSGVVKLKSDYDYLGPRKGLIFEGVSESDADLYVKEITVDGSTQRVLYSPLPLITEGDQIVHSGTPGGGGGGSATYLHELLDVIPQLSPSDGYLLAWDANAQSQAGTIGAWKAISQSSIMPDLSNYYTKHEVDGMVEDIGDAMDNLQAQIDAVSSRDMFDELTASVFFADIIAASDIYGALHGDADNALSLEGHAASYFAAAGDVTALESNFDSSGNAKAALKLTTSGPLNIWGVQYWNNGIPSDVTGQPNLYIGSTQVQTVGNTQPLGGISTITLVAQSTRSTSGNVIEVVTESDGQGGTITYLHTTLPIISDGDQIVGDGTPGGGSGGGATYLHELLDVIANLVPSDGYLLAWDANATSQAGSTGAWKAISQSSVLAPVTALIPAQASASNQLADKAFVNSSIATATATYRGSYNLVSDLGLTTDATESQIGTALASAVSDEDNNDYAFVQIPTSDATPTEIARTDRYKYNGSAWVFEYSLNNSGYTAAQWAAINSGITTAKRQGYDAIAGYFDANGKLTPTHVGDLSATYALVSHTHTIAQVTNLQDELDALSARIDSVASRDDFDELTASVIFADIIAADIFYGDLEGNADTATDADKLDGQHGSYYATASAVSTLQDYFDASGNAKSALKLTTVSKTAWGRTFWTANGVPDSVSGDMDTVGKIAFTAQNAKSTTGFVLEVVTESDGKGGTITYLHTTLPIISDGDQIVGTGTPGGGGGGGATYLRELLDVIGNLYPSDGYVLAWDASAMSQAGSTGAWKAISQSSLRPDLSNYYTKAETYSQAEVNALIGAIDQFHYEIAASTSAVVDPQSNVLYLIGPTGSGADKYEEYVYTNSTWTKIGDTSIDLSNYYTKSETYSKTEVNTALSGYVPTTRTVSGTGYLTGGGALSQNQTLDIASAVKTKIDHGESAYSALPDINTLLDNLQAQVNAVSSRDCYDELTATVFYSDIVAATDIYGALHGDADNALNLEGHAASYFATASAVTTLQGYFDNSGNAKTALKLTTDGPLNLWGVEYWSSGIPKSAAGRPSFGAGADVPAGQTFKIGDATFSWVAGSNGSPGYLYVDTAFMSAGDQIIGSGTPGQGGGGGGKNYLQELLDTAYGWSDAFLAGVSEQQVLVFTPGADSKNGTGTGAWSYVPKTAVGAFYTAGTGLALSNANVFSLDVDAAKTALGLGDAAYLGVASAIGSSVTGLVSGALLYGVLGDSFDSTNTVKAFVNSSIATATATFRGTNTTATTEAAFLTWANALTHDLNDYVFWQTTDSYGNTIYKRYKFDGTSWVFEYNLNNSSFTTAQWDAINSGITSTKRSGYDTIVGYFTNGQLQAAHVGDLSGTYLPKSGGSMNNTTVVTNLNADLLDGKHASDFAAATHSHTISQVTNLESNLDTLSGRIDAIGSRNMFDELSASVFFSDIITASTAYIESIVGSLTGTASNASQLEGHAASYFATASSLNSYLLLSGGTMTGLLKIATGKGIEDATGNGMLCYHPSSWTGATSSQWGVGAIDCQGVIRSSNSDLLHYRGSTAYVIWDSANDGSGSGLDADTVDGEQASDFAHRGAANNLLVAGNEFNFISAGFSGDVYLNYQDENRQSEASVSSYIFCNGRGGSFATLGASGSSFGASISVNGQVSSVGDQIITSDETKKMNLEDIRLSAKDIASVRAVTFDFKADGRHSFGTIAQDWLDILPEAVLGEEGDYSFAYAQAATVSSIINSREIVKIELHETEQDKEIRELKAALGKANGRIADLEKEVERLRMN